jgi:hypothetical protein
MSSVSQAAGATDPATPAWGCGHTACAAAQPLAQAHWKL